MCECISYKYGGGILIPPRMLFRKKLGVCLNAITVFIIVIAAVGYFIFQGIKTFQLHTMNLGLKNKDAVLVEKTADMKMTRILLGDNVCDLYKLRVFYVTKDENKFEEMLLHMLSSEYRHPEDKKSFLETYFHTFLIKGNRKYAEWILEEIKKTEDEAFIHYNENAYAVMLEGRNDLIKEMEEDVNSKRYYGFALGAILFMISKQFSNLGDDKNALVYMQSAKACFHPRAVYMPVVEQYLKDHPI